MGRATLHIFLWLLLALTPSIQELLRLHQNPRISAECDKHVTLNCAVASSREGLSIKRMEWSLNGTSLCSVDKKGEMTTHTEHTKGGFHCMYIHGHLSLVLHKVQPRETVNSNYTCKLRCNRGVQHMNTVVQLQECCGKVQSVLTDTASVCTFQHVHPGGDVHWFIGSRNVTERFLNHTHTSRYMDEKGWWTIVSSLHSSLYTPFNCSLMSTKSGRYLASALVQSSTTQSQKTTHTTNGGGVLTPASTLLWILILLAIN